MVCGREETNSASRGEEHWFAAEGEET